MWLSEFYIWAGIRINKVSSPEAFPEFHLLFHWYHSVNILPQDILWNGSKASFFLSLNLFHKFKGIKPF